MTIVMRGESSTDKTPSEDMTCYAKEFWLSQLLDLAQDFDLVSKEDGMNIAQSLARLFRAERMTAAAFSDDLNIDDLLNVEGPEIMMKWLNIDGVEDSLNKHACVRATKTRISRE